MVVIRLQGGLGNQMFQYAIASILAKKNKTKVYLDNSFFSIKEKRVGFTPRNFELDIFDNIYSEISLKDLSLFFKVSFFNRIKKKINFNYPKIYNEVVFGFNQPVLDIRKPVYLNGYFQSSKYFVDFENYIKSLFIFPIEKLSLKSMNLIPTLSKENTIAVHIRRGDYVTDSITNQFHGSCSLEYYIKAISLISSQIENPTFVFFSDDSEWVKENFKNFKINIIFIDFNKGIDSWMDMFLMSICGHNIIANSSFSWWAAWLNTNPQKKVIAPQKWFLAKDIYVNSIISEEWIAI